MDMGFSQWMALESAVHGNRSKRSFGRATLRRIAAFARPHRRALVAFLVLSVISAVDLFLASRAGAARKASGASPASERLRGGYPAPQRGSE